ncbi:rhodanese-like domain-containing protein [Arthrobacter sp. SAFR-044]|uniref:rhodanese-like domain-containing protein n=1 Tax=Arthrobacter sp. SAFR-044 TaxID=3387278 RepID=UPI003F7B511B
MMEQRHIANEGTTSGKHGLDPGGSPATVTIEQLLIESRAGLQRVQPADLEQEMSAGALVVDTRPVEQRERDGDLPGAVVIDRNVLEWRLDPSSPHRLPIANDPARRIVVVCNEGYSSSLAAHTLQRLGLSRATDLIGGFQAWAALRSGS